MTTLALYPKRTESREVRIVTASRGAPLRVRQRGRWLQVINVQRRWQAPAPTIDEEPYTFFELALEDGSVCTVGRPHGSGSWIETIPGCRAVLPQPSAQSYDPLSGDLSLEGQMLLATHR